ncbi:MAG: hypothetical protein J6P37_03715 [Lachnospiraceae bacterium]|nr:hypothetical protein [Lachnospiraceae bacterium]
MNIILRKETKEDYYNLGAENTRNYTMKKEISKWAREVKKIDKRKMWD